MLDNEHTIATRWRSATGHLSLLCVGLAGAFIALGINNAYNRAETEVWGEARGAPASRARKLFDHSRVLRFMRVWRNQWELQRVLAAADAYVAPEASRELGKGNTEQH